MDAQPVALTSSVVSSSTTADDAAVVLLARLRARYKSSYSAPSPPRAAAPNKADGKATESGDTPATAATEAAAPAQQDAAAIERVVGDALAAAAGFAADDTSDVALDSSSCTCQPWRVSKPGARHIPVRCGSCRAAIGAAMPAGKYGDYRSWRSPWVAMRLSAGLGLEPNPSQQPPLPRLSNYMREALAAQAEPESLRASVRPTALLNQRLRFRVVATMPLPPREREAPPPPLPRTPEEALNRVAEKMLMKVRPRLAHLRFQVSEY